MKYLLALALALAIASPVFAQPAHACGTITSLSVIYDRVDAAGYAPRLKEGSQQQFDCIAARGISFTSQRFQTTWEAANYWLGLLGQELGVPLQPIAAPNS